MKKNTYLFNKSGVRFELILLSLLVLRGVHLFFHYAPPGIDITLLGDMVRLYVRSWKTGILYPDNMMPLFGTGDFFAFHSILAPLIASIEYFFAGSLLILLKLVNVLAFFLYDIAILFFLLSFPQNFRGKQKVDFIEINTLTIFLLVAYATGVPSRYMGSGGGVFILAGALSILGVNFFLKSWFTEEFSVLNGLKIGVLFLLSFLIHPLPLIYTPFIFLATLILQDSPGRITSLLKQGWKSILGELLIIFLINLPFLLLAYRSPSDYLARMLTEHIINVKKGYSLINFTGSGALLEQVGGFLSFSIRQFAHLALFILIGFSLGKCSVSERIRGYLAIIVFCFLAWFGSYLPFIGFGMYPDRLTGYIALIMGVFLLKEDIFTLRDNNHKIIKKSLVLILLVCLLSTGRYFWNYLIQPNSIQLLTKDDVKVIEKLPGVVSEDSLIMGNYMDATVWIPALAGRTVEYAHVHLAHYQKWEKYRDELKGKGQLFRFISNSCSQKKECSTRCDGQKIIIKENNVKLCSVEPIE